MPTTQFDTIVFDLGGVLADWSPHYLYSKIIPDEEKRKWFLSEICTMEWNMEQDAGRSWADATQLLIEQYPEYEEWIRAYAERWEEMLIGQIQGTVDLLKTLKDDGVYRLLALTNWSAETFPIAERRFEFLQWFEGILVSGVEKMKKPDAAIYELLIRRYEIDPKRAIFIDDSLKNVQAAEVFGITAIHFSSPEQLQNELQQLGIQIGPSA